MPQARVAIRSRGTRPERSPALTITDEAKPPEATISAADFAAAQTGTPWISRHLAGTTAGRALRRLGLDPAAWPRRRFERRARRDLATFLRHGGRLALPRDEAPALSVVVVLHNQAHLTYRCLESVAAQTAASLEVVLFDNGSADHTPALLGALDGPRTLGDPANLGFLRGANAAARAARGTALLFLNNDAVLHPEAAARALAHLDRDPTVGALGGRLVMPHGRLQEAGARVGRDGRSRGIGSGDRPDEAAYLTGREVDYCSGAALFVRTALFRALGGFDARYAPAYYEDTDLCFRIREAGHRVRYEPDIVAMHLVSASAPTRGWVHEQIERNRRLFVERHAARLGAAATGGVTAKRSGSRAGAPG